MGLFATLKPGKPRSKKVKEEGCVVTLSVEIAPEEVEEQTKGALEHIRGIARLPGFRAGKAPLEAVKAQFAGEARERAFEALMRKHVPAALEELGVRAVETPSVEDVAWKDGEPLALTVRVETAPTATAKDYLKIPVTKKSGKAEAAALEKRLLDLRESHARLEVTTDAVLGDAHFAVIDYAIAVAGKPVPNGKGVDELVDMAAKQSVEGLTEGLKGAKRGESRALKVKVNGKDAEMTVDLKEIKTKVLPALDVEFAKDLGFETVEQLNAKLQEVLDHEAKNEAEADEVRQIESALVKANPFPLPPSMVERQLHGMLDRLRRQLGDGAKLPQKTFDDLREKMLPRAEEEVRLAFVMNAIAEKEKLDATDVEVNAELEAGLKDADTEEKKKRLQEMFNQRKDQIRHMIRERKTMAFLREKAVYKS